MSRHTLVLLRHGESTWNRANLFTGWYDADLTEVGEQQARRAGTDLAAAGVEPDVVHTSLQTRAIRTANLALDALGRSWLPVRRTWRLNERHYGALTGLDKAATAERFGPDQVQVWRRSYDTPPEPIGADNPYYADIVDDPRYRDLGDDLPTAECLRDVVERMWPWFDEGIAPDLRSGATVLVAAHGNSLRAMVKQLDGIGDDEITGLNLPTGVPVVYELDADLVPVETVPVDRISDRYLGDVAAAEAAAEAVARQAGGD